MKPSKTNQIMKTIKTIWLQSGRIDAMELLSIPQQNYQPNRWFWFRNEMLSNDHDMKIKYNRILLQSGRIVAMELLSIPKQNYQSNRGLKKKNPV